MPGLVLTLIFFQLILQYTRSVDSRFRISRLLAAALRSRAPHPEASLEAPLSRLSAYTYTCRYATLQHCSLVSQIFSMQRMLHAGTVAREFMLHVHWIARTIPGEVGYWSSHYAYGIKFTLWKTFTSFIQYLKVTPAHGIISCMYRGTYQSFISLMSATNSISN